MAGGEFPAASRHPEDAWLARRQPSSRDEASPASLRADDRWALGDRALAGRIAAHFTQFHFAARTGRLFRVLRIAAGGPQFTPAQQNAVAHKEGMAGCGADGNDFRRVPLAEPGARAPHISGRRGHGLDVRPRAQHHPPRGRSSPARSAGELGVSDGVAPPHARRPRVLQLGGDIQLMPWRISMPRPLFHAEAVCNSFRLYGGYPRWL